MCFTVLFTAFIDLLLLPSEFGLVSGGVASGSCELLSWAFTSSRYILRRETEKTREEGREKGMNDSRSQLSRGIKS